MTDKQKQVSQTGIRGEKVVKEWLEDGNFKIIESFSHPHADYYDIKANRGNEKWIIEVKTGENPSLNISNFIKMTEEKGYNRFGLALVHKREVYLLEVKKQTIAAQKAWKTMRK